MLGFIGFGHKDMALVLLGVTFLFWITKLHRLVVNVILAMAPWAYNSVLLVTLVAYYRILTIQQAVQTNVHTIQGLVRVLG